MSNYRNMMDHWLKADRPFSASETRAAGIPSQILAELCTTGEIEKLANGVYISSKAKNTENLSLQIVALRAANGVVCLLSALRFHDLTTQLPHEVWLAVKAHSWIPKIDNPALRVVAIGEPAFSFGVEEHKVDGIRIRVYSIAKTIADCFKFRNKIGLDVALEALREGHRQKRFTVSELMAAAEVCRVTKIITPYLESLYQ